MALVPCHECKAEISDQAKACPQCGAKPPAKTRGWLMALFGIGAGVIALLVFAGSSPELQARGRDRSSIDVCWRQQKDPAFSPETARFIASTCEKMETDFKGKYGVNP